MRGSVQRNFSRPRWFTEGACPLRSPQFPRAVARRGAGGRSPSRARRPRAPCSSPAAPPGLVSVDQSTGRVAAPLGLGGPAVARRHELRRRPRLRRRRQADRDRRHRRPRTAGFTRSPSGIMGLASSPNGSRLLAGRAGAVDVLAAAPLPGGALDDPARPQRPAALDRDLARRLARARAPGLEAARDPRPHDAAHRGARAADERHRGRLLPRRQRLGAPAHAHRRRAAPHRPRQRRAPPRRSRSAARSAAASRSRRTAATRSRAPPTAPRSRRSPTSRRRAWSRVSASAAAPASPAPPVTAPASSSPTAAAARCRC